jgi:hypothetical protein
MPSGREGNVSEHCRPALTCAVCHAQEILAIISMTILGLFLLENILLIIGLGPRHFFTNAFYVLDLVVVVVSLALEVRSFVMPFVR